MSLNRVPGLSKCVSRALYLIYYVIPKQGAGAIGMKDLTTGVSQISDLVIGGHDTMCKTNQDSYLIVTTGVPDTLCEI